MESFFKTKLVSLTALTATGPIQTFVNPSQVVRLSPSTTNPGQVLIRLTDNTPIVVQMDIELLANKLGVTLT